MPLVHIELVEGRTNEQKTALAQEIAESIVKHTGAPKSAIHIIFNDMKKENYFPAGEAKK
ncbi:2-hydroxymuconate tautomerase [Lactococcus nasutitermitis]|uniref:2-hydroxymuconate tautomerase n=1 Tax=Lactococcus nasutitermitis TaxID=1652957 RepID=A0ABV9JDF2_9LACT|nr:2-hydroxymuconate tautomerase [Lactococcus nasutitermitis]